MSVSHLPPGYHTVVPQLSIDGAAAAIDFFKRAFGAEQLDFATDPSGKKVWHAALRIGESMVFVNDVFPEMGGEASRSAMWLYVPDTDASFKRAVDAGAKPTMPPNDAFWGDRFSQVADPYGNKWTIATRIKNMTPDEIRAAEQAFIASMKSQK